LLSVLRYTPFAQTITAGMRIPLRQYGILLSSYLQPQKRRVGAMAIALLTTIALQILNPQLLGLFIDTATTGGAPQTLVTFAAVFILVAVVIQALAVVTTYLSETVAWSATNALRLDLAAHCLKLDLSHHKSRTPGEWVERIDGDITALSRFFSQLVIHVLGNGLLLVGILIILFFEDWRAGLSLSLFSWVALTMLLGIQSLAIVPWTRYRQKSAEFFGFIAEQIAGREDLRANGAVGYVMHRFYQMLRDWLPIYHKARFGSTLLWAASVGLFTVGNAIALALVTYLWHQQTITIGTAYLIFHYTNLLSQPIERIREELEQLQQVEASIHRIQELFQLQSNLPDIGHLPLPSGPLSVSFKSVYFSYPPSKQAKDTPQSKTQNPKSKIHPSLHSLSFHLPPGQTLGILGHTGSGKTTIARLLLRFYDIQQGEICIGERATTQVPLTELRQRVGLVTQDVQLFQATIRDNLTFFDTFIQDEDILQTLDLLGLSDWLNALPAGLDTILSADSRGLSAGQAQLLAFARVFLKDPGLVILDEASSRLDPTTEELIERAVDKLLEQRTGIIIAHRLKTIQRADQILILEKGKVVEYGDRQTLIQTPCSRFAQLLKLGSITLR